MTNIMPTVALDTTNLLTAIPGLLGFLPEQSLVVLAFDEDSSIAVTARHDLLLDADGEPTADMWETMASIGLVCERDGALGAVGVVVDNRYGLPSPVYRRVLADLDDALIAAGVPGGVRAGFVVERFAAGMPWYTALWAMAGRGPTGADPDVPGSLGLADGGFGCGLLADPQSSPVALERSLRTGRVVMASRSEMYACLATTEHCVDGACGGRPRRIRPTTTAAGRTKLLRAALKLLTGPAVPEMTCANVVLLSRAVRNLGVRDALLVLGGGEHRWVAESVWRDLTRRTRGEVRASAATMLAHLYYLGGEGAYTGVALDVALQACPDWRLAGLLDTALTGGVHPSMLWEVLGESYSVAAGLGVTLPSASSRLWS
ncbi:DUF4192 domain-containing protein [Gordonia sp. (in: high G+C Gram-positive bacteria)]|uniref:DUF4192 domain-containing protein n=2 Tax=unclassified Gordonia (in: high G+C Gram-positive bacteria) TaxID=2657482 RepID=UPI000FAEC997|nr:DUF4192 domain-containing protein [Gordonia sp. (in: high G+C Gram-positive bacteria)]RUP37529.1 MAG: DUF4192 domain-containing protein [Gordonia sp. (in: high G+C Gram-positive bacteria)]